MYVKINICGYLYYDFQLSKYEIYRMRLTHTHTHTHIYIYTKSIRNVSSHCEYLENQLRDHDVIWQSKSDLLRMHVQTVSRGVFHSVVRRHWMSLCVV